MATPRDPARERRLGFVLGVGAYATWGVVPLFWHQLRGIDAIEILAHRAAWGLVAFALFVVATRQVPALLAAARQPRAMAILAGSGLLLAGNWGLFIWATLSGHLLQASLGYFINPLVSVALGCRGARWPRSRWRRSAWCGWRSPAAACRGWRWRWPARSAPTA